MTEQFDIEQFMSSFLQFEIEYDLFSITVKDHCFWDYIRYSVFYACVFSHYGDPYPRSRTTSAYAHEVFRSLRFLGAEWLSRRGHYDIMVISYDRVIDIEGKRRNMHVYPFIKALVDKYRILLVDRSRTRLLDEDAYPCQVMGFRPFHFIDRSRSFLTRFNRQEHAVMAGLSANVRDHFGIHVDILALARSVFALQLQTEKRYLWLFKKYSPRLVVYADDANMKGVMAAARRLGIPTVDLQHSLVSSLNILYTYTDVPEVHEHSIRSDYVFTYGDFWRPYYRLPVTTVPVGFPHLEAAFETVPQTTVNRCQNILVIGQRISRDIVAETALNVAQLLPDYSVYYKLRSEEYENWEGRYPAAFLTTPNFHVIDSNEIPLHEWFTRCQYQIGINSTALCEGLAFGLTTFILETEWYAEMTALIQAECVFLVSSAEEITDKIRRNVRPPREVTREELFRRGSLKNLRYAVEAILTKGES